MQKIIALLAVFSTDFSTTTLPQFFTSCIRNACYDRTGNTVKQRWDTFLYLP